MILVKLKLRILFKKYYFRKFDIILYFVCLLSIFYSMSMNLLKGLFGVFGPLLTGISFITRLCQSSGCKEFFGCLIDLLAVRILLELSISHLLSLIIFTLFHTYWTLLQFTGNKFQLFYPSWFQVHLAKNDYWQT